jgi:hypothetical protein
MKAIEVFRSGNFVVSYMKFALGKQDKKKKTGKC